MYFLSSWIDTKGQNDKTISEICVQLFKKLSKCFPKWLFYFTFSVVVHESSSSSTFLLTRYSQSFIIFLVFYILAIVIGVQWYLIVVFISISIIINDVKNLFMSLFTVYQNLFPIKNIVFFFSYHYILEILQILQFQVLCQSYALQRFFSQTVSCFFIFLTKNN